MIKIIDPHTFFKVTVQQQLPCWHCVFRGRVTDGYRQN